MTLFSVTPSGPDAFQQCGFDKCDTFTRNPGTDHFEGCCEKLIVVSPDKMQSSCGWLPYVKIC